MRTILTTLVLLTLAAPAAAARASLAVMPVEWGKGASPTWRSKLSTDAFTLALITRLTKTQKFDVIERAQLHKVFKEHKLTRLGLTDPTRAAKVGKLLGADYLVYSQISKWSFTDSNHKVAIVNNWRHDLTLLLVLDVRVVAVQTGKIVQSDKVQVRLQWRVTTRGPGALSLADEPCLQAQEQAVGDFLVQVLKAFPMKIIQVKDGVVFVNYGKGTGIQVGQVFEVCETGEALTDPDTGEVLGQSEKSVGRIKITELSARYCKATLLDGKASRGAVCKRYKGEKDWPPTSRPGGR
jgi:hypothetical protein